MPNQTPDKAGLLTDLAPYIYGTTRLGDEKIPFEERVSIARAAMEGATSRLENLREFLSAAQRIEPLPQDIIDEKVKLHYRWSDELDMKAEHWSM